MNLESAVGVIDKYKFERFGGVGCSNSDYRLHRTTCCGGLGVEDVELLGFYFDPTDLGRRIELVQGCSCPFCGVKDWGLEEVNELNEVPEIGNGLVGVAEED